MLLERTRWYCDRCRQLFEVTHEKGKYDPMTETHPGIRVNGPRCTLCRSKCKKKRMYPEFRPMT